MEQDKSVETMLVDVAVKAVTGILKSQLPQRTAANLPPSIGKFCIVRTRGAGVHAGIVESSDELHVVLRQSRRLWSWKADKGISLSAIATQGIDYSGSRLPDEIDTLVLNSIDVYEQIPCTADAERNIKEAPVAKAK